MDLLKTLSPLYNDKWKTPSTSALVSPFSLPPQTLLILADVDAGSNTPSMVGKVLAWQRKEGEAGSFLLLPRFFFPSSVDRVRDDVSREDLERIESF